MLVNLILRSMYFNWTGALYFYYATWCSFRPLFFLNIQTQGNNRYVENPSVSQLWNASSPCKLLFTAVRLKFEWIVSCLFTSLAFHLVVCLYVFVVVVVFLFLSVVFVYANRESAFSQYGVRNMNSSCSVISCLSSMARPSSFHSKKKNSKWSDKKLFESWEVSPFLSNKSQVKTKPMAPCTRFPRLMIATCNCFALIGSFYFKAARTCCVFQQELFNRFLRFLVSLIKNGGTLRKCYFSFL